jgi:hypothetical protein
VSAPAKHRSNEARKQGSKEARKQGSDYWVSLNSTACVTVKKIKLTCCVEASEGHMGPEGGGEKNDRRVFQFDTLQMGSPAKAFHSPLK